MVFSRGFLKNEANTENSMIFSQSQQRQSLFCAAKGKRVNISTYYPVLSHVNSCTMKKIFLRDQNHLGKTAFYATPFRIVNAVSTLKALRRCAVKNVLNFLIHSFQN